MISIWFFNREKKRWELSERVDVKDVFQELKNWNMLGANVFVKASREKPTEKPVNRKSSAKVLQLANYRKSKGAV